FVTGWYPPEHVPAPKLKAGRVELPKGMLAGSAMQEVTTRSSPLRGKTEGSSVRVPVIGLTGVLVVTVKATEWPPAVSAWTGMLTVPLTFREAFDVRVRLVGSICMLMLGTAIGSSGFLISGGFASLT